MTLERGRPASSVDRAIQGWRNEAIKLRADLKEARTLIEALRRHLADTIAERDALIGRLTAIVKSHDVWLEEADRYAAEVIGRALSEAMRKAQEAAGE